MGWLHDDLAAIYPQFGLRVAHQGLLLTPPTDVELLELAPLVGEPGGIVEPGDEGRFLGRDPDLEPEAAVDAFLRHQWSLRERPAPARWRAPFAVVSGGRVIGIVVLAHETDHEPGQVSTWSWLARAEQGRGLGQRVRLMVLELAFAHLGATLATTSANEQNGASRRVSARCGYRETHRSTDRWGVEVHAAVTPASWRRRRLPDVEVDGAAALRARVCPRA